MMEMGFRFVVIANDFGVMLRGAKSDVDTVSAARTAAQTRERVA